jgi:dephospho-CoA kinase
MLHVGLTGNVGAGKSTVVSLFAGWGATIIDTDILAREVVQPGSPTLETIRETFGEQVIAEDGALDRAAMRRAVFGDPELRWKLEDVLHPAIRARYRELLREARERDDRIVIGVVPLLYETDMQQDFDVVLVIDAPADLRVARLVEKRGLTAEEARAVTDAQMSAEEKRERADIIIDNESDITTLERRAWETWKELEKMSRAA